MPEAAAGVKKRRRGHGGGMAIPGHYCGRRGGTLLMYDLMRAGGAPPQDPAAVHRCSPVQARRGGDRDIPTTVGRRCNPQLTCFTAG
jgi:hypothetical protein